jgi:sec-independent protein translocase protein TatA
MFGGLGMWEIILIFMVALLLFGAKRLPEIGSSLGKGIREFKGSLREIEGEFKLPPESRVDQGRVAPPAPPAAQSEASDDQNNGEPRKLTTSG